MFLCRRSKVEAVPWLYMVGKGLHGTEGYMDVDMLEEMSSPCHMVARSCEEQCIVELQDFAFFRTNIRMLRVVPYLDFDSQGIAMSLGGLRHFPMHWVEVEYQGPV